MGARNNLDNLFRDRFSNVEVEPSTDGWVAVESRLARRKKSRRMALIRWSSTAAALVLAFYSGYYWQLNNPRVLGPFEARYSFPEVIIVHEMDEANIDQSVVISGAPTTQATIANEKRVASAQGTEAIAAGSSPNLAFTESGSFPSTPFSIQEPIFLESSPSLNSTHLDFTEFPTDVVLVNDSIPTESFIVTDMNQQSEVTADDAPEIVMIDDTDLLHPKNKLFRVGAMLSPTIAFRSVNIVDESDVVAENVPNDQIISSLSYGLELAYRIRNRWQLEAGFFFNQWEQSNDRLVARVSSSLPTADVQISSNNSTGNIQFNDASREKENFATGEENLLLVPELYESYSFYEIPVGVSYYLMDHDRFAWKLKAGLSPRFLSTSIVELQYQGGESQPIENLPLKDFSLQFLVGSGVEYRLIPELRLNITPTLQYGLTPVNQHDVVNTYFHQLLIYSGLSYSF